MGNPNDYSKSYIPSSANKYLSYKTNRPKLTRQDLMNSAQQYAMARPQTLANPLNNATAPIASLTSPGGFDAMESARQRREARQQISDNLREVRGMRGGLSVNIPSI
jgi:hypothetical protein